MIRSHAPRGRRRTTVLSLLGLLLVLGASAPVWLQARNAMPQRIALDAPHAAPAAAGFRVIPLDGVDSTRSRDVPARLFWPQAARKGAVPLVLFSHGIGSSDDGYTHLGRYWAQHGIASLHVRHVGSDRTLWQGNPLDLVQRFQHAAGDDEAMARAADLHWALDHLLASPYASRIDQHRITVAGHSYGANTAMLLAGARVLRDGQWLQFADPRVSAAILISAPPFYGDDDFGPILGGIAVPTLHVTTLDDIIRIPGFGSGVADREKVFGAMGGDRTLAMFHGGSHNVFTDRRYFDSLAVADAVKASTRTMTLAFLQALDEDSDTRFATLSAFDDDSLDVRSVHAAAPIARVAAHLPISRGVSPAHVRGRR